MALCGIIKHHDKNEKPCVLGFWHFLTSESIAGLSASLSATESCKSQDLQDFSFLSILSKVAVLLKLGSTLLDSI